MSHTNDRSLLKAHLVPSLKTASQERHFRVTIGLALAAACEAVGAEVIWYAGDPNWQVGNRFVAAMGEGNDDRDAELRGRIESMLPDRKFK